MSVVYLITLGIPSETNRLRGKEKEERGRNVRSANRSEGACLKIYFECRKSVTSAAETHLTERGYAEPWGEAPRCRKCRTKRTSCRASLRRAAPRETERRVRVWATRRGRTFYRAALIRPTARDRDTRFRKGQIVVPRR